jgi:hypothetical protein
MLDHCPPWELIKLWKIGKCDKSHLKGGLPVLTLCAPDLQSRFAGLHYGTVAIPLACDFNANGMQLNFSKLNRASSQWKSVPLLTW